MLMGWRQQCLLSEECPDRLKLLVPEPARSPVSSGHVDSYAKGSQETRWLGPSCGPKSNFHLGCCLSRAWSLLASGSLGSSWILLTRPTGGYLRPVPRHGSPWSHPTEGDPNQMASRCRCHHTWGLKRPGKPKSGAHGLEPELRSSKSHRC